MAYPKRQERLISQGLCYVCGKPRGNNGTKTMCRECADKRKMEATIKRNERLENGLCTCCGVPRGEDGTTIYCRRCADNACENYKKRAKLLRPERYKNKLCISCGKPLPENYKVLNCERCRLLNSEYTRRTRLKRKENNLCVQCGSKKEDNNTLYCNNCLIRNRETNRKFIKKYRNDRLENKLCLQCGRERYQESNFCRYHFIENIARKLGLPSEQWEILLQKLEQSDFKCFYTGIDIVPGLNACVDHVIPKSKNKNLIDDLDNLVWCDKRINIMKSNLSINEFTNMCQRVVATATKRGLI